MQAIRNESNHSLVVELYNKNSNTMLHIAQGILKNRYRSRMPLPSRKKALTEEKGTSHRKQRSIIGAMGARAAESGELDPKIIKLIRHRSHDEESVHGYPFSAHS